MPTAPVNRDGAVIYYEDSGAPGDSTTYLTVIVIHGMVFHGGCFLRLFPHAAAHNLRIVAPNLRDYPGSTPYTATEMQRLLSPDVKEQILAARDQGLEVASFLRYVITKENLPKLKEEDDKITGGVVLLSWSFGSIWPFSMLANEASLDDETKSILHSSLRTLVIHESAYPPFGLLYPEELYFPGRDPTLTQETLPTAFGRWATTFYTPITELTDDVNVLASRKIMHQVSTDAHYIPTVDQISLEELPGIADPGILQRSGACMRNTDLKVWAHNAEKALFDCNPDSTFGRVNTVVFWCDMGVTSSTFTASYIAARFREAGKEGRVTRKSRIVRIDGANHMIHWHEPEKFLRILVENTSTRV